mgnify:CR=1 FL=1
MGDVLVRSQSRQQKTNEHRRCFNNIIDYCNSLCYHGKLQPKRGMEKGRFSPQWDIYILMVEA